MNKNQKLVQQAFLNNEEEVISRLETIYGESLAGITKKVKVLDSSIAQLQKALGSITDDEIGELALAVLKKKNLTPAEAQETIRSMIQAKVYQKQYQEALKKQVGGVLDKMGEKQYTTVSDYLTGCYQDGFIGTMYDLQGQGIPLCMPIDQESVVRAVQLDSKISKGLYTRLGEDVTALKRKITAQISRGVASGLTYREMAQQLAGETRIGFNNAVRIARTEGHRIQCQAGMDACEKAQEKGCDVLKQWDATLDGNTRESHSQVDGEIRELDKPFSNGLMFPGDPSGGAAEVINCRCALLQRASWELDEEELEELKKRAEFFGLDKSDSFEEYKQKYLKAAESQVEDVTSETIEQVSDRVKMKHNITINTDAVGDKLEDAAKKQIEALDGLLDEYNSTLVGFRFENGRIDGEGGSCYMLNGHSSITIRTSSINKKLLYDNLNVGENVDLYITYHEFAHAFSQSKEGMDDAFWKEIKGIRTKYRKALKEIEKSELVDHTIDAIQAEAMRKQIFISSYANKDIDEFLAEAFAQARLSASPSPFATEVLSVVDKYFKKPLTKTGKSGTIELLADINKMLTPRERRVLDSVPKKVGYFDFAAHGEISSIIYGDETMRLSAREVAKIILHNKGYHGEKVRLLSCSTGATDDGFAQQLANALGVEVEAPTGILLVYPNGTYKIGYDGSGEMRTFKPGGKG